jgi:hypothetical protein
MPVWWQGEGEGVGEKHQRQGLISILASLPSPQPFHKRSDYKEALSLGRASGMNSRRKPFSQE